MLAFTLKDLYKTLRRHDVDILKHFNDDDLNDSDNNLIYINKQRRTVIQKHSYFFNTNENEYNNDYKYDLNRNKLLDKINKVPGIEISSKAYRKFVAEIVRRNVYAFNC